MKTGYSAVLMAAVSAFLIMSAPVYAAGSNIGIYTNGTWYLDFNGNGAWDGTPPDGLYSFGGGLTGAVPVTGDWTGTGTTKIGVYDNGTWYLDLVGNGAWVGTPTDGLYNFGGGLTGAIPVTGDWTGTGTTKIGVYDNGVWYLDLVGNGVWSALTDTMYNFGGQPGAIPVTGDWTGTGTTKIGVYVNGVWYLDLVGNGVWSAATDTIYSFGGGVAGAIPVTGDWTGTGKTKIGIYANGVWYLDLNGNGAWDGTPTDGLYSFGGGLTGAVPVTGKWVALLPDTGQTACYNSTGSFISCTGAGQDGSHIVNPLSYTDNGNGTVTDNVTGLLWQQCTNGLSGALCSTGTATTYTWSQAISLCTGLSLAGASWRLPTDFELVGIEDYGTSSPSINAAYFPNTQNTWYWSSTPYLLSSGFSFMVNFGVSSDSGEGVGVTWYVRCVSGGQ